MKNKETVNYLNSKNINLNNFFAYIDNNKFNVDNYTKSYK